METKIQKWGNSLAVRLPKDVVLKQLLREGSNVTITSEKDGIIIKQTPKSAGSLQELVKKMTKDNLHTETLWGKSIGKEVW
jgi:antitoxin MazE